MTPNTYTLIPLRRWHVGWLLEDGLAEGNNEPFDDATLNCIETQGSWSLLYGDKLIACGGVITQWKGRHTGWMLLNKRSSRHMVCITRITKEFLVKVRGRVEMTVRKDFPQGQRWAEMLGFQVETPILRGYGPEGEDHIGYVMINGTKGS